MNTTIIHISDILNSHRIDVAYYKNNIRGKNFVPLSKYVDIKGGKRIPKGKSFSSENTDYLYLRLSDIEDFDCIDYDALKNISEELFNTLKRYEVKNEQIVFSIAGTIGRVFVIKNIPNGKRIILTENCAKLLPRNDTVFPDYVALLLNCDFVQRQIEQSRIQTTIPKIGLDRIAKLRIPEIPLTSIQQEIIGLYSKAQEARLKKNFEAKLLLNSIDDYLFDVLHIGKISDNEHSKVALKQKVSSIIGGRFDPMQFHYERIEIINRIKQGNWCRLKDIVNDVKTTISSLSQDNVYIGMENIDGTTGEYCPSKEKESISSAAKFKNGDILFPKLRPYLNKVYRTQFAGCCSTEFHVFEAHDIDPEFLTIVLRSNMILAQTKHLMTGNTLPRLQTTDIDNLIIPYPDIIAQEEIVKTVSTIKNKAKRLKKEGNALLEEVKQKIEKIILE